MSITTLSTRSNTISGIKFQSINDIPNLQLWLDASDTSKVQTSPFFADEAWYFNENSTIYTNPSNNFVYGSGQFTIEAWIYTTSVISSPIIYCQSWTFVNYFVFGITPARQLYFFDATNSSIPRITTSGTIPLNQWVHVALVRENLSTNQTKIYINGTLAGSGTCSYNFTDNINGFPTIGRYYHTNTNQFIGYMSNLRIVNGKALYTTNFNPSISAAIPLQPISQSGVTTPLLVLQDSIVTQNNGTVPGITLTSSGTFVPYWLDKSPNALTASQIIIDNQSILLSAEVNGLNVLNFDGINDFFTLSTPITTNINYSQFFVFNRRQDNIISTSLGTGTGSLRNYSFVWWNADNRLYSYTLPTNQYRATETISASGTHISSIIQSIPRNTVDFYLDNSFRTISLANITLNQNLTANEIGRSGASSSSYFHNGMIGEIIQMAFEAPPYEVNLINQKLINKWRVPKQVPFLKTAPILSTGTSTSAISSTLRNLVCRAYFLSSGMDKKFG